MKKTIAILLSVLSCALLFTGCSIFGQNQQPLAVYSFCAEDSSFSVSNGVIVLDDDNEICYGGNLEMNKEDFADIVAYSTTIYLKSGSEKYVILSGAVEDKSGQAINISADNGTVSGDIIRDDDIEKLADNLWFELKTTDKNGEKNTYQIQLDVIDITEYA